MTTANMTNTHLCPQCNKTFKNLRLHRVKAHEKIVIEIPNMSWCASGEIDDWVVPRVKYNGILCEESDGWATDNGGDFTQLYEFPQEIINQNNNTYFGLHVTFSPAGHVLQVEYRKVDPLTFRQTEPIGMSRVTTVHHF